MLNEKFKTIAFNDLPDGTTVITCLLERLDDYFEIERWTEETHKFLNEYQGQRLIFDLSDVKIITSQAVATLLSLKFQAKEHNLGLALCGLNENNAKLFRITSLDYSFVLGKTVEQAAERLRYHDSEEGTE